MNEWIVENTDSSFDTLRDKNTVYTISNGYYAIKGEPPSGTTGTSIFVALGNRGEF